MIKFKLTNQDYLNYQKYLHKKKLISKSLKFIANFLGAVFSFCFIASVISLVKYYDTHSNINHYELNWGISFLLVSITTFIVSIKLFSKRIIAKMYLPDGIYLSEHTITITEEYLHMRIKKNEYKYYYEHLLGIELYADLFMIFVDKTSAILIPSNAFADEEIKKEFITTIDNNIKKYRLSKQVEY